MNPILLKPSFYALVLTGILSLVVFILILGTWSSLIKKGTNKLMVVLSMFGMLVGVHGLLHLGLESVYNYNPIEMIIGV